MLPFMKDDSNMLADQEAAMIDSQAGQDQEFYTVSGQGKKVRNSTAFLFALFGIGLIGLWFMTQKTKLTAASASTELSEDVKLEVAISRLTGVSTDMMDRMDRIVNTFYEFSNVLQIGVDDLRKNPFELETFAASKGKDSDASQKRAKNDVREIAYQKMLKEFKQLSLISIMESDTGSRRCVINGSVLVRGNLVKSFEIKRIEGNSVELHWKPSDMDFSELPLENRTLSLKLPE